MRYAVAIPPLLALAGCGIDFGIDDPDAQVQEPVRVTETFEQRPDPKVDVLWVVDNTGSMAEEQAALAESFDRFAEEADAANLAYQLGVVTTDMSGDAAGVLQGNPWIITPALDDPGAAFADAVSVGTDAVGAEAGLAAMLEALSPELLEGANRGFRRADAALHVVVVSDDDDDSGALLSDPVGAALALLDEESSEGAPAYFSALVCTATTGCSCGGSGGVYAADYIEVAQAAGGVISDVCEGDLGSIVATLGEMSITYLDTFELQATPETGDVLVWVDGVRAVEGEDWVLLSDPPAVQFYEPPPAGAVIEISYAMVDEEAS